MIKIILDAEIYPVDYIKKAADAYSAVCTVLISKHKSSTTCRFINCKYNEKTTADEFCNYILDLYVSELKEYGGN